MNLASLIAGDGTRYVTAVCPGKAKRSAKLIVTTLRSLLGWPHPTGTVTVALGGAVPAAAGWRLARLAEPLEPDAIIRLLASRNRRRAVGRRDYAISSLLARLRLRAGEDADLSVDDVDWRHDEIAVTGKGKRAEQRAVTGDPVADRSLARNSSRNPSGRQELSSHDPSPGHLTSTHPCARPSRHTCSNRPTGAQMDCAFP